MIFGCFCFSFGLCVFVVWGIIVYLLFSWLFVGSFGKIGLNKGIPMFVSECQGSKTFTYSFEDFLIVLLSKT